MQGNVSRLHLPVCVSFGVQEREKKEVGEREEKKDGMLDSGTGYIECRRAREDDWESSAEG